MIRCLFLCLLFCGFLSQAQQAEHVDFLSVDADLFFGPNKGMLSGNAKYKLKILKDIDSVYIDNRNDIEHYEIHNSNMGFGRSKGDHIIFKKHGGFKKDSIYKFSLVYFSHPKKAIYFVDDQIWTQGQGKYTSNWLPSIDDTNDKIEFDLNITYDKDYQVLANGKLVDKQVNDSTVTWRYDMKHPMPSYLVALAIGKYDKQVEYSESGIPLEYYYYPEDSLKVEPTYRYTKRMFDFMEKEIGVPYPWQNYKQVPVKDFLYSGMENTSLTIFSDAYVVDDIGFNDKNYVNVNAHELAHQWFGDFVTAKSGEHHWLQEGFATYYALLAERDIFGNKHYIWELYKTAQDLMLQDQAGQGTSLLNPKASSLTFYQRGAWVLHMLRQMIGDDYFRISVKNYLEAYAFGNATTEDFINEVEAVSGYDLSAFVNTWIKAETFPYDEAMEHLKAKSTFIQEYLMVDCELKTSKCEYYLNSWASDEAKAKIVNQVPELVTEEVFKNNLKVRQAIAKSLRTIPAKLKTPYENLLNDNSYMTKEAALANLWVNFPEERSKYLDQTKSVIGFNDRNVRQLWLVLALNTEAYHDDLKQSYYDELVSYTSSDFGFETRQLAFSYLNSMNAFSAVSLQNLKDASTHHNWRFKKFAKELIEVLSQNPEYKKILETN
ncbi:M1 family aminopeptidase [Winogradskyella sp. 3972H.M.0a.05]|uniref:M1 family metallopeptidase n=1 Tax=Winogradskyella sp. 3972H.M.0a.05 TaxID=2950277 RepID=UPI00339B7DAF